VTLYQLAEHWRAKAARIRERYRGGMPAITHAATASSAALETCAEELEAALKAGVDTGARRGDAAQGP
jgi:hypothetical protein